MEEKKFSKSVFKRVMESTNGYKLYSIRILWWCIFNRSKAQLFIDKINAGMHWQAAFNTAKTNQK